MIALSPRHQAKAKKNAAKHRTSSKQNWREWKTLEIALAWWRGDRAIILHPLALVPPVGQ